ncbi:hypothetical protein S1OALGB6SA_1682 [Olavius algarvensis spirochete endosymbiont]|nr:hypothetical protein S1OALGB6SA_1682 [Olavius algarvensis spirochete endosymbiont]
MLFAFVVTPVLFENGRQLELSLLGMFRASGKGNFSIANRKHPHRKPANMPIVFYTGNSYANKIRTPLAYSKKDFITVAKFIPSKWS